MKTDSEIQIDVMDQISWEPALDGAEIGVSVNNGIVTLFGKVENHFKKIAAERAAKKVAGVKAVVVNIQVDIEPAFQKNDAEIAKAVLYALKWNVSIPDNTIKVIVEDGNVILEGEVAWDFQRTAAKNIIEHLVGVKMVYDFVTITPVIMPANVKQKIVAAFERSATVDAAKINVTVDGRKVTLTGKVRSFAEEGDAVVAAWSVPGVAEVDNQLELYDAEFGC